MAERILQALSHTGVFGWSFCSASLGMEVAEVHWLVWWNFSEIVR